LVTKTRIRRIRLDFLLLACFCASLAVSFAVSFPRTVQAGALPPVSTEDVSVKLISGSDATVVGVRPSIDLYFPGPGDFSTTADNMLKLTYSHSPLLLPTRSTMTVRVNEVPVASVYLTADNAKRTTAVFPITPVSVPRETWHVQVSFYMRLTDEVCSYDTGNSALTATVYSDTSIHYAYGPRTLRSEDPDLDQFPAPFLSSTALDPGRIDIVLPAEPDPAVMTGAGHLAAALGRMTARRNPTMLFDTDTTIDATLAASHDLIVVGQPRGDWLWKGIAGQLNRSDTALPFRAPAEGNGEFTTTDGVPLPSNLGVLVVLVSPFSPDRQILLISGNAPDGVLRAADTLSTARGRASVHGPWALVTQETASAAPGTPQTGALSGATVQDLLLSDSGRSDIVIRGLGDQLTTWPFWSDGGTASIPTPADIYFSHSNLLNASRSSLRIDLNDVPVGSTNLDTNASDQRQLHLSIPAGLLHAGLNRLTLRMNLELPASVDLAGCVEPPSNAAWAVIYGRSALHLVQHGAVPAGTVDLGAYPYPFVNGGSLAGTAVVLPRRVVDMAGAPAIIADLGNRSAEDVTELQVRTDDTLSDADRGRYNLLVVRLPGSNKVVQSMPLPLAILPGGARGVRDASGTIMTISDSARVGILEVVASPWAKDRAVLVASGRLPESLQWDAYAFNQGGLRGTAATVARDLTEPSIVNRVKVTTFDLRPKVGAPLRAYQAARDNLPLTLAAASALFSCLLLGYMAYRVYRSEQIE